MGRDLVSEYDRRFPGVGIPAAQKEERMQRDAFYAERDRLRRMCRTRGVVFGRLPLDENGRLKP